MEKFRNIGEAITTVRVNSGRRESSPVSAINSSKPFNKAISAFAVVAFLFLLSLSIQASAAPVEGDILTNRATLSFTGAVEGVSTSVDFTVGVITAPPPPVDTDLAFECTIRDGCVGGLVTENVPGQTFAKLTITNPGPAGGYSFVVDDNRFEVINGELKLKQDIFLNFEQAATVDLLITVTDADGNSFVKPFSIQVEDVNDTPSKITLAGNYIPAGQTDTRIGRLAVVDEDVDDTASYSVIGDDRFVIQSDGNGNSFLAIAAGASLDEDTQASVTIEVKDGAGATIQRTFIVSTNPEDATVPVGAGNASLTFMAPDVLDGSEVEIPQASCSPGAGFIPASASTSLRADFSPTDIAGIRPLSPADAYAIGDPVIISVKDANQNIQPFLRDSVTVTLTTDATNDVETITLIETGPDTGIFVSYVFTTNRTSAQNDCVLTVQSREKIKATYTDTRQESEVVEASIEIAPVGIVFDEATGEPVNGVIITLVNVDTDAPAEVRGDGPIFALYPSSVKSGEPETDRSGASYAVNDGEYRFPAIPAGKYRLEIFNDRGVRISTLADVTLQNLNRPNQRAFSLTSTGNFALSDASRGQIFQVSQGALPRIDIPIRRMPRETQPAELSNSEIEFLQYSSNPSVGTPVDVGKTSCVSGQSRTISELKDVSVPVPGVVNLLPSTVFKAGQPIFVRVKDADQNVDPALKEKIVIQIDVPGSGDREYLELTETGVNSGEFVGYVQSTENEQSVGSCMLGVVKNEPIVATYSDAFDQTDVSDSLVLIDPFGRVFSTKDGRLIDGITVTLIDTATGQPARVFGDGPLFADFPSTIVTGSSVSDAGGLVYNFPMGEYRFPFVQPGLYRLQLDTIPDGLIFPSTADLQSIQSLAGAPFEIVDGSKGDEFVVPIGPALNIDVPVDEPQGEMFISKQASKSLAAIGDFIQYKISVQNNAANTITNSKIRDTLPKGFRYQSGSLRVDGVKAADPTISADGRTLLVDLASVGATSVNVSYVTEITAGAEVGAAINSATVIGDLVASTNVATATVTVTNDLFSDKAFLVGKVEVKQCGSDAKAGTTPIYLPGVRLYLEDGSYVVTDESGAWHMEGIEPGTHVVQMDVDTLPERYEASPCNDNSRFAGSPYSQFVDLQGGTLWRVDFAVQEKAPPTSTIKLTQSLKADDEGFWVSVKTENSGPVPLSSASAIYNVPKGWKIISGSEELDGEATTHTSSIVGAVFDLGAVEDKRELRFKIEPSSIRTKQIVTSTGENRLVVLQPRFKTRSAELSDGDKQQLDAMINAWRSNQWEQITVVGHTDNVPIAAANRKEFASNKALSESRAAAVAAYLEGKVSVNKLMVVGAGDKYPIADNTTASGRASNRRVELLMRPIVVKKIQQVVDAEVLNGESSVRLSFKAPGTPKGKTDVSMIPLNRLAGGFKKLEASVSSVASGSWDLVEDNIGDEIVSRDPNVQGFINLKDGDRLARPVTAVKLDLDSRLKPRLSLDGVEIPNDRIGFSAADNTTGKTIYSYVGVHFGDPGKHVITFEGLGPFGNARFTETLNIVRVGDLFDVRLVDASGNVADGTTPIKVKLKLTDRSGESINIPQRLRLESTDLRRYDRKLSLSDLSEISDSNYVDVSADGILMFNPVSTSGVYRAKLKYAESEQDIEVFVEPEKRDWIMVGLAEGTTAYRTLSGNMQNIADAGIDDELDSEGRVAFYAKGQVKGEFILTLAYDTDKEKKDSLNQTIDPNSYYTLYGDRTQTQYDAASQEKLYLKLERNQFYALFGDFNTGLQGGELSNYSRSFSGLKSEYKGDKFEVVAFASKADQGFVKDEIRGDGTSGLYRLSTNGVVVNTEKITIETRDRFHSQDILQTKQLQRHLDYNIDYDAGTIFFKEPIFSQDTSFNPIFVVIDYEVNGDGTDKVNTGGRIAYKPNKDVEVGLTLVKEGVARREGELAGVDLEYNVDDSTKIRAEMAGTRNSINGVDSNGKAYVVEATRRDGKLDSKAYIREQEGGFGLGQQNSSESGSRKLGMQGTYQIAEGIEVAGELYRETSLGTGQSQDVASTTMQMNGDGYTINTGLRSAKSESGGQDQVSNQLLVGGSYEVLDGRMTLSANAETPIAGKGEAADFPKRLRVGLDYKLNDKVTLKAEQEFSWGDDQDSQGTRIGMSSQLWKGGELVTNVEQNNEAGGQNLAAVAGLKQRWELNDNWSFDFGVDRSQTMKKKRSAPALQVTTVYSSPDNDDFTSMTFGSRFQKDAWDWSTRVEYRQADTEDKLNLVSDIIHNLDEGQQLLAKVDIQRSQSDLSESFKADIQLGYSYRPDDSRWTIFNRLDLRHNQTQNVGFDLTSQKIINNLNANFVWNEDTQVAFQYGLKYVVDNFDNDEYRGFTDLYGMEVRHDLGSQWDVGFQGSLYNSWDAGVSDYSYGVSLGYNMARNVWVSLGYNFSGFEDTDFSAADYSAEGVFLKYRVKFDQDTARSILGLMDN